MRLLLIAATLLAVNFAMAARGRSSGGSSHSSSKGFASGSHSSSSGEPGDLKIDLGYGYASISPSSLNTFQDNFQWSNTTYVTGTFNKATYYSASIGYKFIGPGYLGISYEHGSQASDDTQIVGKSYRVQDSVTYEVFYLTYDVPFKVESWLLTLGIGGGSATKFEFHQFESPGEDVNWQANPNAMMVRASAGYMLTENIVLSLQVQYTSLSADKLTSEKSYNTTINNQPIGSGQTFYDPVAGSNVKVDLSGVRYGLGLSLIF